MLQGERGPNPLITLTNISICSFAILPKWYIWDIYIKESILFVVPTMVARMEPGFAEWPKNKYPEHSKRGVFGMSGEIRVV